MGRFRSFLRKIAKPAAMATVAGGVALSLVVTTPSNAEAAVLLPPPILLGSGVMPLGEALALVAPTGPIGWTIVGLGALALGAYATRDYWMPYVTGAFGDAQRDVPNGSPVPGMGPMSANLTLSNAKIEGRFASSVLTYANQPTGGFYTYTVAYRYECKWDTGGANTIFNAYFQASNQTFPFAPKTLTNECRGTQGGVTKLGVPVGAEYGLVGSRNFVTYDSTVHKGIGPTNYVSAGAFGVGGFDPKSSETKYSTSVECIRADGSKFTITKSSTGADGALAVPSCEQAVPGSHSTGKLDVVGTPPASTGRPAENIYSVPAYPAAPGYELCATSKPGPGCVLMVKLDGKECVVGLWECAHWSELKNDGAVGPRLSCQYGPYSVTLDKCNPLERAYETGGAPATEANMDGNPATRSDTDPKGQQIPKTDPSTGTGTGSSTFPSTGTNPSPAPTEDANCSEPSWSWNPVDFVKNPVVCALRDAFVPKMDIEARTRELKAVADVKAPLSWMNPQMTGPGTSGCPDWVVHVTGAFDFNGGYSKNVVCESTFTAAIVGARNPLFGIIAAAMIWPLLRSLYYAAIPVLRVTPTGGK
jgi:hypothetical protein